MTDASPIRCFWCNTDPEEAAARHEGPHATWCLRYRRPASLFVTTAHQPPCAIDHGTDGKEGEETGVEKP